MITELGEMFPVPSLMNRQVTLDPCQGQFQKNQNINC